MTGNAPPPQQITVLQYILTQHMERCLYLEFEFVLFNYF